MEDKHNFIDFGPTEDKTKHIIKVVGVGGGGCNAVRNMYAEGIKDVTFAVCNTDSKSLSASPVPVKIMLGETGLGAGSVPERGRSEAEASVESIKKLFSDSTKMVFVTAGMGGGTGTGAAPVIAGIAKEMGLLTIGIVTIPFFFEKEKKIIKALKGVEEMRRNVDSLLIINNERICDIFANTRISVKDAFKQADNILNNAVKSISELITIEGDINLDFCDVEATMKSGGGAIMAIGRAGGEHRVQQAIVDALDSPLLYGSDISRAKRILFNIYTSEETPLFVNEMQEVDAFMDTLDPQIEVIWGVSDDNTLGEDAKIAILATGLDSDGQDFNRQSDGVDCNDTAYYREMIKKLYSIGVKVKGRKQDSDNVPFIVKAGGEPVDEAQKLPDESIDEKPISDNTDTDATLEQPVPLEPNPYGRQNQTFIERMKARFKTLIDDTLME